MISDLQHCGSEFKTQITRLKSKLFTTSQSSDADLQRLERNLADYLGALIKLDVDKKQKGMIQIHFNSLDEFEGILQKIGFSNDD